MNSIDTHPKYGEVYLVNFDPSTGHEYQKMRPAIVIQSDDQLKRTSFVTIMPLTSQIRKKWPEDILVKKNHSNCLFADSIIKVHSIASFDKARFIKKIGVLDKQTMDEIKTYLKIHFGL